MLKKIIKTGIILLLVSFLIYFLFRVEIKPDGDVVEYFGITQTFISHLNLNLTQTDINKLLIYIDAPKFSNPGYYVTGVNGERFPVHFFAYSLLLIPTRFLLALLGQNLLRVFPVTNFIILVLTIWLINKYYLTSDSKRLLLFGLIFFSPLVFFVSFPGPDIFYLCLLLISLFAFQNKQYFLASFLTVIASWQSQPLMLLALLFLGFFWQEKKNVQKIVLLLGLFLVPYCYNFLVFGKITPWLIFQDEWTKLYGFGIQNISLFKFFEQFFDPNLGLFWYAPLLLSLGGISLWQLSKENKKMKALIAVFIITVFFYQTNPAWNYGTAGYGPSRHILFLLPFCLWAVVANKLSAFKLFFQDWVSKTVIGIFFLIELYSLSFNGYIIPDTTNSLKHSPYATYLLNNYPSLYNPTGEIFTDRTNHLDSTGPVSAVYKDKDICKKAYVLRKQLKILEEECGFIPEAEKYKLARLSFFSADKGIYVNY